MGNERKQIFTLVNLMLVFMLLVSILIGLVWYKSSAGNEQSKDLEKKYETTQNKIAELGKNKAALTPSAINQKISEDNIHVEESLRNFETSITEGFVMAYNEVKSEEDYEALKEDLPGLLGESVSDRILELDKPIVNQTGQAQVFYDRLDNLKIGFGEYDSDSNSVEGVIIADFSTKITQSSTSENQSFLKGQDYFKIRVDLMDDDIKLLEHQQVFKERGQSNE